MSNKKRIIVIISFAIIIQFIFIGFFDLPIVKDAKRFERMGYQISKGGGFSEYKGEPSRLYPGAPIIYGAVYFFTGRIPMAAKAGQAVLFSLLCVFMYYIGRITFGEKIGFTAALLCAAYPPLFVLPDILTTECVFTISLSAVTLAYILSLAKERSWLYCLTGLLCAWISYVRPTGLFIIFFLMAGSFIIFRNLKKVFIFSCFAFLFFIIGMLPITVRNYMQFNAFVPVAGIETAKVTNITESALEKREHFAARMAERQYEQVKEYYDEADINVKDDKVKEKLRGWIGNIIPQDYTWRPTNPLDGMRRLYIGSYSDLYQIGIPIAFFLKDKRLLSTYPHLFAWKLLLLLLSSIVFALGMIGMLMSLRQFKRAFPVLLIIFYNTLFYLSYSFLWNSDVTTRYGLPVVPYFILFSVLAIDKIRKIITNRG